LEVFPVTTQLINLDTPVLPDPARCAWLEANGIDPAKVPAAQEVLVEDGQLTFVEFLYRADGRKLVSPGGEVEKILRTVPLVSAPENHGL
jgi:hypothetical protein